MSDSSTADAKAEEPTISEDLESSAPSEPQAKASEAPIEAKTTNETSSDAPEPAPKAAQEARSDDALEPAIQEVSAPNASADPLAESVNSTQVSSHILQSEAVSDTGRALNDPRDVGLVRFDAPSEISMSRHKEAVSAKGRAQAAPAAGQAQIRESQRASNDPRGL